MYHHSPNPNPPRRHGRKTNLKVRALDIFVNIVCAVIPSVVTAVCAFIVYRLNKKIDRKEEIDLQQIAKEQERAARREIEHESLVRGMTAILRNEIISIYVRWKDNGKKDLPLYEREVLTQTYQAYHTLGGKGSVSELFAEMTGAV